MTDALDHALTAAAHLDTAAEPETTATSQPPPAARKKRQTLEQKLAEAQARAARLLAQHRAQSRALETGQKILVGATVLARARKEPRIREWLLRALRQDLSRDIDKQRIAPLIAELEQFGSEPRTP